MISVALIICALFWGWAACSEARYPYSDTWFVIGCAVVSIACVFAGVVTIGV
jgi:succinate dehydrogenase/fumarate reductase cytochrome b subunit